MVESLSAGPGSGSSTLKPPKPRSDLMEGEGRRALLQTDFFLLCLSSSARQIRGHAGLQGFVVATCRWFPQQHAHGASCAL